jgi:hypothetical protein
MKIYTFEEIKHLNYNKIIAIELLKFSIVYSDLSSEVHWFSEKSIIKCPHADLLLCILSTINIDNYFIYNIDLTKRLKIIKKSMFENLKNDQDFQDYITIEQRTLTTLTVQNEN